MIYRKKIRLKKAIRAYKWICRDESVVSHSSQNIDLCDIAEGDLDKIIECILPCPDYITSERDIRMLLGYLIVTCHLGVQFHPNKWSEYAQSFSPVRFRHISAMLNICNDLYMENKCVNIYELILQLIYELELPY